MLSPSSKKQDFEERRSFFFLIYGNMERPRRWNLEQKFEAKPYHIGSRSSDKFASDISETIELGGHNVVVEVDESFITPWKGRHGRLNWWLFGATERCPNISFLSLCRQRIAVVLITMIRRHVRPGTTIMSDMWRAYRARRNGIQAQRLFFYLYFMINHTYHFGIQSTPYSHTDDRANMACECPSLI